MKASLIQPALIGGLVSGVLSALPLIAGANLCCCLWIVSGGVVAAYLLQQNQTGPVAAGDGALVGLLAGVIGAFVYLVVSIPINLLVGPMEERIFQGLAETMNNMPPEFREYAERSRSGDFRIARVVFSFIFMLFLGAVFSTIGGLVGGLIFGRRTPPGVIDVRPVE
ncbi:MAG: hypothetical protein ABI868_05905 [Acidobacteriota bacterium]